MSSESDNRYSCGLEVAQLRHLTRDFGHLMSYQKLKFGRPLG